MKLAVFFSDITGTKHFESLPSSQMLQSKLREAGQRINELTKEREQLIKLGNKLRAELLKYKGIFFLLHVVLQELRCTNGAHLTYTVVKTASYCCLYLFHFRE